MKKENKSDQNRMVYSTDLGSLKNFFDSSDEEENLNAIPKNKQMVRVTLDRKQRGGKEVTLVTGLEESDEVIKQLGSFLKTKCGVGGSTKDGDIIVQGDHREKVIKLLIEKVIQIPKEQEVKLKSCGLLTFFLCSEDLS